MLEATKCADYRVRAAVVDQLGSLDKRWALLGLIPALDDDRVEVRSAAFTRLSQVSGGLDFGRDKAKWQAWYDRWRKAQRAPGPR
jgi:HEAT repeat protein